MLKKSCFISLLISALLPITPYAASSNLLKVQIQFDSENYGVPLHFNKIIKINPEQKQNNLIMTQSKIVDNFPITVALVVKAEDVKDNQVTLQFNLLNYGFKQHGGIYTQPKLVLLKNQAAEIKNQAFTLKVIVR